MQVQNGNISVPASAALGKALRVKYDANMKAELAGAADQHVGVTQNQAYAADEMVAIVPRLFSGTVLMTASAAITAGATVNAAADGKVAPTGTVKVGIALEAASGDGAQIEVQPMADWS